MRAIYISTMLSSALLSSGALHASSMQTPQDRADPAVVEEELRDRKDPRDLAPAPALKVREGKSGAALARPVRVDAVRLEGATALPRSVYAPVIEPYKGRTLNADQLQDFATEIAEVARREGFGLASAWIPEQTVRNGLLVVQIDEGRIDDVRVLGAAAADVRPYLDALAQGVPVRTADIERSLLLAGDLPGVTLGRPKIERSGGRSVLVVNTGRDAVRGRAALDNWGSNAVGPVRLHLSVDLNGLLTGDDRLTVGGVITPLDPEEFGLARLTYSKAVGVNGTEVTVSGYAAHSQAGGFLSDRDFDGRSLEGEIGISHPFLRSRDASLTGTLDVSVRDAEQTLADVVVRKDRLAIVRAGSYVTADALGGNLRARLTAARGLGILDATREGDPLSSRDDGSAIFSKLEFWGHYDRRLAGPFSVQLQGEAQVASRALLSSEEMGLGGRYFLRGYDYREFSGDKGVAGSVELRFDLFGQSRSGRRAQLYGYADAGTVGNYGDGGGGGSLASAGGGVRAAIGRTLDASLEFGVPLKDGADPDDSRNPRISFVIGSRFE